MTTDVTSSPATLRRAAAGVARSAAPVVSLGGLWSLVSIPLQSFSWPGWIDTASTVIGVPTGANFFAGAFLLLLGESLRRRLRAAWWIVAMFELLNSVIALATLAYLAAGAPGADGLSGTDRSQGLIVAGVTGVLDAALVLLLIGVRDQFPARRRKGSTGVGVLALLGGLAVIVVLVWVLTWVAPGGSGAAGDRLWWAARNTLGFSLPLDLELGSATGATWLAQLAGVFAAGTLLLAVRVALRSSRRAEFLTPPDELDIRALLLGSGQQDSLGYFSTRRDKSVVFGAQRQAAIAYRVIGTVALAAGDPIGPADKWPGAITEWLSQASRHAWHPAVLSASEDGARAYVAAGLQARAMGDEAVVDVDRFTLEGSSMRPVKRAVARVRAAGYGIAVIRHSDLPPDQLSTLAELAERWRGDQSDRGFSMALNRLGSRSDGRNIAVTVRDAEGEVVAFQSYVPWGRHGLSLDLMRRSKQAVNGVNEAMVAALMAAAPDLGVRQVSLNFAMFRGVFARADRVDAGFTVQLADRLLGLASRYWQLESLAEANAKYLPRWESRYLCYAATASLAQIGVAAGIAEGFLPGRRHAAPYTDETSVAMPDGTSRPLADLVIEQEGRLLTPTLPTRRVPEQQQIRLDRVELLRASGMEPYPVAVPRSHSVADALTQLSNPHASQGDSVESSVSVIGRVRSLRNLGGVQFAMLEEQGRRIQALLDRRSMPSGQFDLWRRAVDVGDHVSVTGTLTLSRSGEPSVQATDWAMASKCLRPLPSEHVGLTNPEARVRQRYLDLIVNPSASEMLKARSRAVAALRQGFVDRGYMEVETPMLQAVHGGASARPFRTHINAYRADLSLRIAPELYLKQLCVGGMDRIFELNRNFRNEGADATHNPEFTSVEAYAAHGDYNSMRELTRELILEVATAVHGEPVAVRRTADGASESVRLDVPWPVVSIHESVSRATGVTLTTATPVEQLREVAATHDIVTTAAMTAGEVVLELYDELVEPVTTTPTFYTDFPLATSPLTRTHRVDPQLSERWDLVAFGAEIGTAYSELVDPIDQRARLTEQSFKAAAGDPEAMEIDEAFLAALEYGMPPTGGLGIGVDRLIMMLTGANIRATLAFPFTRPTP